jgi:chitin disaccharide deacetylase
MGHGHAGAGRRAVIINGDDFGRSPEINAAIIRAHRDGVLTSASLMVAEPASDEAIELAKDNPSLDVGLHLVVCTGRSVLPPSKIAPLVDSRGHFTNNSVAGGLKYFLNRRLREKLAAEIRAQVENHLKRVGYLNHIDGHLNFHVHPVIADLTLEVAAEYRVPCIRLPREPALTTISVARDHLPRKLIDSAIFRSLSRRTRKRAHSRGIRSTDWLFGLHQTGFVTEDYVLAIIDRLRPGVTEIYFHPAMDVGGVPPSAASQRETEILVSPRVREALASRGVELTNYAALGRAAETNGAA